MWHVTRKMRRWPGQFQHRSWWCRSPPPPPSRWRWPASPPGSNWFLITSSLPPVTSWEIQLLYFFMNESLFRISLMKLDFTSQREQHVLNCLGCLNFYKVEIKMSCKINYINTELYFKILNVMSNQLYNSKKLVINSYKLSRRVKRFWHPRKN